MSGSPGESAGSGISLNGRWRITPPTAPGGQRTVTDTFHRAEFEYRPGTWAITVPSLYAARAFINGYLAGLYRSSADPFAQSDHERQ